MADRDPTPVQPPDIPIASAQARSEIEEYLEVSQQRHKLFPRAAVVGLLAGSVAVLFRAHGPVRCASAGARRRSGNHYRRQTTSHARGRNDSHAGESAARPQGAEAL